MHCLSVERSTGQGTDPHRGWIINFSHWNQIGHGLLWGSCLFLLVLLWPFQEHCTLSRSVTTTTLLSFCCVSGAPRGYLCHLQGQFAHVLAFQPCSREERATAAPLQQVGLIQSLGEGRRKAKFMRNYALKSFSLEVPVLFPGDFLNSGTWKIPTKPLWLDRRGPPSSPAARL